MEDEKERENGKARKTREGDLLALVASKQKFVPDTLTWPLPRLITHFCDGLPLQSLICTGVPFANTPPATVKHLFPFEPAREIVLGPVCKLGIVPEGQKVMVNPASPNPGQRCRGRFGGAVPGAGNRVGGDVNAAPSLQSLGSSHFAGVQNPFDSGARPTGVIDTPILTHDGSFTR